MKGMPIVRNVTVRKPEAKEPAAGEAKANPLANLMVVTGFDKKDVLFKSNEARTLQWYDSDGELMAMLIKINSKLWGLCLRGDDDWDQMVELYGA